MYLIGDIHGDIHRVIDIINNELCEALDIIALGDVGINYYLDDRDVELKQELQNVINQHSEKKINVFFVRGNHECRPEHICTYKRKVMYGGECYVEDEYPNLIFLKDGEVYKIDNKTVVALGGGFSDDWFYRLLNDKLWVDQELLYREYERAKEHLNKFDDFIVLSHMLPSSVLSAFNIYKDSFSKTEVLLESVWNLYSEKIIGWYAGHYHKDAQLISGKSTVNILYKTTLCI